MEKYITGLKYGTWQTRLYVIAIPIALLAGIGVIVTAFITNIIGLFLVGVVFLIGGAALILNYNIDEGYITNSQETSPNHQGSDTNEKQDQKTAIKHGDLVVGSITAEGTPADQTAPLAHNRKNTEKQSQVESMQVPEDADTEDGNASGVEQEEIDTRDKKAGRKRLAAETDTAPEDIAAEKKEKRKREKQSKKERKKKTGRRSFWERLFAKKNTELPEQDEDIADSPKKRAQKSDSPKRRTHKAGTDEEELETTESIQEVIAIETPDNKESPKEEITTKEPEKERAEEKDNEESGKIETEKDKKNKPASNAEHNEDELTEYNEVVMKQVFYKYKVKRDHMTIMIDVWDEKGIKQLPAYIWVTKGQVHILTIGQEVNQYTIPMSKAGTLYYKKGVICQAKEEYLQFRKESMLATVFSPYLPTYHEGNKNHRPVIYKNLFALENGLTVTNTSAKTVISMLNPKLEVDDIVTRDVRFNDYFKEIYKLGLLFREQIYSVKEYQAKVSDVLRRYVTSGVDQEEYENTLQSLYQHKLITEEYILYYMQYYERIQMEHLEQAGGKKNRKRKKSERR